MNHPNMSAWPVILVLAGFVPVFGRAGEDVAPGWEWSYKAGLIDGNGALMGGSTIVHLVGHRGSLYAGNSYWQDSTNIWYGGKDAAAGWAQVLRLDKPGGQWSVDLALGPQHLRVESLSAVTFKTDGQGKPLKEDVTLLFAGTYSPKPKGVDVNVFTRDDATGAWEKSTVYSGPKPRNLEDLSVRAIASHHDRATGVDRVFISLGKLGVFSGVYDAAAVGKVRWGSASESGPVETRPLAIIEADGALLFSAGRKVYRRNDGASPTYTVIHDMSDLYPAEVSQPCGGIRGLTALPNAPSGKSSLLFAMVEGPRSRGAIYRLDPSGDGTYTRVLEVCLADLMSGYLDKSPVPFVLAAYNDFCPLVDPSTRETVHLVGFEAWVVGRRFPVWGGRGEGGFYKGAMYAIRDRSGNYRLKEVNGRSTDAKPPLVAPYAFAVSPFKGHEGEALYFGGHDANDRPSHNMAWVFSVSLTGAL